MSVIINGLWAILCGSKVVSKREFNFVDSPIFVNVSIAAWDPGKYNGTLADW